MNKLKVKQWSTVEESKNKIRGTSMKVRGKSGTERKEKNQRAGKELTHVQTLRLGSYHCGSHDNLSPSPVLWIIHGALDDTCDVTCSQATYQASIDCKDYANNFRKSKDFLQTLRRHYAMSLRHNFLLAIMQNENVVQGNVMQEPY
jgi:hypothetical protein